MNLSVLIGGILLLCFLNILFSSIVYSEWIKKDSLNAIFPTWKGTKKKYLWFIFWTIFLNLNIIVFVILNFILIITREDFIGVFFLSYIGWGIINAIIYFITKKIFVKRINDNSKKLK